MIQATAFNELAQLACKNSKKRVELFSCIGKELQQSVWHRIMTACFQVIGELRTSVDTEYKGIQPGMQKKSIKRRLLYLIAPFYHVYS